jgi:hypothetical protein
MQPRYISLERLSQWEVAVVNQFPALPANGIARVFWTIGLLVALVGGAIFAFGIISFMVDIATAMSAERPAPPAMGPFIRSVSVGFPLAMAGGVVAWLASVISPPRRELPPPEERTVYNIHNPQGNLTWSGRDTVIYGGQHVNIHDARQHIQYLQSATPALGLAPRDRKAADQSLASAQRELNSENPNLETVAGRLEQYTQILERSGALYRAGANVIGPLRQLGGILGPLLGRGIVTLLAGF